VVTIIRDGQRVAPLIGWAEHVASRSRVAHLYGRRVEPPHAVALRRAAAKVRIHATEGDVVPWDLRGLPLEGLTRARARLVRETLSGYPVRFTTINDELYGRDPGGTLGVFETIVLEGEWAQTLEQPYDIKIATNWDERQHGPACGSGTRRVLGPGALASLEVLAMDPWDRCEECFCWRPRAALVDVDAWMRDDPTLAVEYRTRLLCREGLDREGGWWCS
jgi:hypothetical protein